MLEQLLSFVPSAPDWHIDWGKIEQNSELAPIWSKLQMTEQNPQWHREIDVMTHTRMVCEALVAFEEFRKLELVQRQEVFLSALFHDIGKIPCTKLEDGVLRSPKHTSVGAKMTRELLWKTFEMCGTESLQMMREVICCLIRHHSMPPHIVEQNNPERKLIRIAAEGQLAKGFSIRLLCMLEKADMIGRIADNIEDSVEAIQFCEDLAEELGCLDGPISFLSPYTRHAYLSGRNVSPDQELFDDTWGEVILMSGLPGTGKDTYIQKYYQNLPMISLDEIRQQLRIAPSEPQGAVIAQARDLAKEYLRKKQPFVWDATSLSPMIREKQLELFHSYGASVRIVYLETEWKELLRRNRNRKAVVPEAVIHRMLGDLVLPTLQEAETVEWNCV